MDRGPGKATSLNLLLPLIEGRELLVVLIEELKELLEDLVNLLINPGSISELDYQIERVNHRKMLQANLVILQIVEDQTYHAHNLLFVREVKDLSDVLNDVEIEVLEELDGEFMVAKNPEAAADVVGDLGILLAFVEQKLLQSVEAALVNKVLSQLVDLEEVHKGVGICMTGQLLGRVFILQKVVEEVLSLFSVLLDAGMSDEHSQGVASEITLRSLLNITLLVKVAIKDTDAVKFFGLIATLALLKETQVSNTGAIILNDTINHCKSPSDQIRFTADLVNDDEQGSHQLLASLQVSISVEELSLLLWVHSQEFAK